MSRKVRKNSLLAATALLAAYSMSATSALAEERRYAFDIGAAPLATALKAVGLVSHQQIAFPQQLVAGRSAPALRGAYTPEEALARLLNGTGLEIHRTPSGVFVIQPSGKVQTVAAATAESVPATSVAGAARPEPRSEAAPAPNALAEVVVTATRQTSTVNRVPLSITAATQQSLDQLGVRSAPDLQRIVPGLAVSSVIAGVQTFSIRGVTSFQGAATTGVYLDDTALQKRNVTGAAGLLSSNGSPSPPLYDLERVEVLRGPQGTLYGGSSEGGTIRYITPQPSLTTYSGSLRGEMSRVKDGGVSSEVGFAVGGPIVQDKLGFRVSALNRRTAGYIDMLDPYKQGSLIEKDANSAGAVSLRAALAWAPSDRAKLTAAYTYYEVTDDGGPQQWTLPVSGTFTTPAVCFDTSRQFGQSPGPRVAVPCAPGGQGAQAPGIYQRPSQTYGPYPTLGRDKALASFKYPVVTDNQIASLTFDYDFGAFTLKAISSYLFDKTKAKLHGVVPELAGQLTTTLYPTAAGFPLFAPLPNGAGDVKTTNRRYGESQEIRLASAPGGALSWVVGGYYANLRGHGYLCNTRNQEEYTRALWGLSVVQAYGVPATPCSVIRDQSLKDTEVAGFADAHLDVTQRVTATAGVRLSSVKYSFNQAFFGTSPGIFVPTFANTGLTAGSVTETPVTPKFGLEYRFTPSQFVYVNAAKGFRAGGVNTPVTAEICGAALRTVGLTVADIPTTYGSDSVWSYEAGGKFRLLNGRLQLNSSAYRIDWTNVQLTVAGLAGCPQNWVQNAGRARSQGFDLDVQARIAGGFSASFGLGYTDAQYTADTRAPAPPGGVGVPVVRKGDPLPVPPWQANVGLRYDGEIGSLRVYARGDYFYQGEYLRSPGPGVAQFAPDSYKAPSTQQVNVRVGTIIGPLDVNLFVNNLFDSKDELTRGGYLNSAPGGRGGCSIAQGADCTTFTSYNPFISVGTLRPREFGLQSTYRF